MSRCTDVNVVSYEAQCKCDIFWLVPIHEVTRRSVQYDWHDRWQAADLRWGDLLEVL